MDVDLAIGPRGFSQIYGLAFNEELLFRRVMLSLILTLITKSIGTYFLVVSVDFTRILLNLLLR